MADTIKFVLYHYDPSFAAAVIFIALFFITTFLHVFQLAFKRTWYFIPFVIGGFCEFYPAAQGESLDTNAAFQKLSQLVTLDERCQQSNHLIGLRVHT